MSGNMPKAYLRLDPNIDQAFPSLRQTFIGLLCAANRQPVRGRFRSRRDLEDLLGRAFVRRSYQRGDVVDLTDGRVYVPGWDEWQEGDLTVAERMRRLRERRNTAVTPASPGDNGVTLPTSHDRIAPPKALGVGVGVGVDVLPDVPTARAPGANDPFEAPEAEAMDWLRRHKCLIREGDGNHQRLIHAAERHGVNAIVGQFDRLARAGTKDGDLKGFLYGAIDLLDKASRPNLGALEAAERETESRRSWDARVEATRRRSRELHPELYPEVTS